MQKFKFEIQKVETLFAIEEIEADSEEEARTLAFKKSTQGVEAFSTERPIIWDLVDKPRYTVRIVGAK